MPARSARSGAPDGTPRSPTHTAPARRGSWPVSNGTNDSRPEPSRPATPTISPRPTAKLAAASAPTGQTVGPQAGCPGAVAAAGAGGGDGGRPADDELDQPVVVEPRAGHRGHEAAVAQDRHVVGHVEYLVEVVGHEHDPDPSVPQAAEDAEQAIDLVGGEGGRGLVEHEHLRGALSRSWRDAPGRSGHGLAGRLGLRFVVVDGAGDGEAGALGHRERGHRRVHVDVDVHVGEGGAALSGLGPPTDLPEAAGAVAAAERQVVDDAEAGDQAEVLVDEPETELVPGAGDAEPERLAADRDRGARVGGVVRRPAP